MTDINNKNGDFLYTGMKSLGTADIVDQCKVTILIQRLKHPSTKHVVRLADVQKMASEQSQDSIVCPDSPSVEDSSELNLSSDQT